ncbi:hypothetical protein [Sphingomonas sp. BAUL-RG-20F-R05-02]|uniref:hypothetical protein n=1 Tax=Sphingomonas sp. BAUL-RG-20F-R05-02 TaxID=2914830 RepID=UPI001F578C7B|nr:hypothetical protein [Sphingomonas sp. BAUL-RG-20F-R05-02]
MLEHGTDVHEILGATAHELQIDDLTILREGWRRFERELEASIAAFRRVGAPSSHSHHQSAEHEAALDRMEAVGDLHRLLRSAPDRVALDEHVSELILTLARCTPLQMMPTIEMDLITAPVDGRVCRGVNLMLVALIAGELAGGPIHTDGHVEIDITLGAFSLEVRVRDVAGEPPDRVVVGGKLLRKVVSSLGAKMTSSRGPGIATVLITVPLPTAFPWRTSGNA